MCGLHNTMGSLTRTQFINQNTISAIVVFCKMNSRFTFYLLCFAILKNWFWICFQLYNFFGDSIYQYEAFNTINSILKNLDLLCFERWGQYYFWYFGEVLLAIILSLNIAFYYLRQLRYRHNNIIFVWNKSF